MPTSFYPTMNKWSQKCHLAYALHLRAEPHLYSGTEAGPHAGLPWWNLLSHLPRRHTRTPTIELREPLWRIWLHSYRWGPETISKSVISYHGTTRGRRHLHRQKASYPHYYQAICSPWPFQTRCVIIWWRKVTTEIKPDHVHRCCFFFFSHYRVALFVFGQAECTCIPLISSVVMPFTPFRFWQLL